MLLAAKIGSFFILSEIFFCNACMARKTCEIAKENREKIDRAVLGLSLELSMKVFRVCFPSICFTPILLSHFLSYLDLSWMASIQTLQSAGMQEGDFIEFLLFILSSPSYS
jgi:hypothetical protein